MKLFFMPGACSLAAHIALREARLPFALEEVDYATRRLSDGTDYRQINPKGYVPGLLLDDGRLLTETPVILQYIDAAVPVTNLLGGSDPWHRFRVLEWLNFVATEIHKSFSPLFRPSTPAAFLAAGRRHLSERLAIVEQHLHADRFLTGSRFTATDAYLFTVCRWLHDQDMALSDWPSLASHSREVASRESVKAAIAAEGLVRETRDETLVSTRPAALGATPWTPTADAGAGGERRESHRLATRWRAASWPH